MERKKLEPLDMFILIAAGAIVFQFSYQIESVRPISFAGLGVLPAEALLSFILFIIAIGAILIVVVLLSIIPGIMPGLDSSWCSTLSLVMGSELVIFGLVAINLSGLAAGGLGGSCLSIGVELFSLGLISIASFVSNRGSICLIKDVPNYAFLLLPLLLLPAAFLIIN